MALMSGRLLGRFGITLLVACGGMWGMVWKLAFDGICGLLMCHSMASQLLRFLRTKLAVPLLILSRLVDRGIETYFAIFFRIMCCWRLWGLSLLILAARVINSIGPSQTRVLSWLNQLINIFTETSLMCRTLTGTSSGNGGDPRELELFFGLLFSGD